MPGVHPRLGTSEGWWLDSPVDFLLSLASGQARDFPYSRKTLKGHFSASSGGKGSYGVGGGSMGGEHQPATLGGRNWHGGRGWVEADKPCSPAGVGNDREKGLHGALVLPTVSEDERALPPMQEGLSLIPPSG